MSREDKRSDIEKRNERDRKSIKCPDCENHIMMLNSISWENSVDGQYRPIYEHEETVNLEGTCIGCLNKVKFSGILKVVKK